MGAALEDIEQDLDELNSMLAEALADFEGRLESTLAALPSWFDSDDKELGELFLVELPDGDPVSIGPRAASAAAAHVDAFVRARLSTAGGDLPYHFDEQAAAEWRDELDELDDRLGEIERRARKAATSAERELGARLDAALASLDHQREQDEEALRKEVALGRVKPGEQARKKEAKLWEEQREKASALREGWGPLEELPFEGADLTVGTVTRLRKILESAVDALIAAYPELRSSAGDWAKPTGKRARKFNVPRPMPKKRDPGSPSFEVDDARRITEPIDPTSTQEYQRHVERPLHDTSPPPIPTATPAPPIRPTPSPSALATTSPADATAPLPTVDEPAQRVLAGWDRVRASEIALIVGPPIAYIAFLLLATVGYGVGLADENPFRRWHWAFGVFIGAAAYLIVMPALMSWRVRWDDRWPILVRYHVTRQDSFVRVAPDAVIVGGERMPFDGVTPDLQRSNVENQRGWALILQKGEQELSFRATATIDRWNDSDIPYVDDVPDSYWNVSEETLLRIAQRASS